MKEWRCPICDEEYADPIYKADGEIVGCGNCVDDYFADSLPRMGVNLPPGDGLFDYSCPSCGEGIPDRLYFRDGVCIGCEECIEVCNVDECRELIENDEDPGMDNGKENEQ